MATEKTILDEFAMSALTGLYAACPERASMDSPSYWAETAYDIATAMVAEKEKREKKPYGDDYVF